MSTLKSMTCPLCNGMKTARLSRVHMRDYISCSRCGLVFMDRSLHPSAAAAKARYSTHNNSPESADYRVWLDNVVRPLSSFLEPAAKGLDFGCGPGPALSVMMGERGHACADYDPLFFPDAALLEERYDFITCTEVLEHLSEPGWELARLHDLLNLTGLLAVMTGVLKPEIDFASWWYVRDFTHVCFYRPETLAWIGRHWGMEVVFAENDVMIFQKGPRQGR